jgi:HEAT repeat protein
MIMRHIKVTLALLVVSSILGVGLGSYAQTRATKKKSSSNIPADVQREIERLVSLDPTEQAAAVSHLRGMGPRAAPAIPYLIRMLGKRTTRWSFSPITPPTFPGGTSPFEITSRPNEALETLIAIGRPAVPALMAALKAKDAEVRADAAQALGGIQDARAVAPLVSALRDEDMNVRERAAETLGKINDAGTVKLVTAALRDSGTDYSVRRNIVEALRKIDNSLAIEPLIVAMKDSDWRVRLAATQELARREDSRVIVSMIAALADEQVEVRSEAAKSLGKTGNPRAVEPLIAALNDKAAYVRYEAMLALGKIKDTRAVEPLIASLNDKVVADKFIRETATVVLRMITGQNLGEDPDKWQKWWSQNKGKLRYDK